MKNYTSDLAIVLFLLVAPTCALAENSQLEFQLIDLMSHPISADISTIRPSQRNSAINFLRLVSNGKVKYLKTAALDSTDAQILLLRMADIETIDNLVSTYRRYDSRNSWERIPDNFQRSKQPALIPYLAEDLSINEDATKSINYNPPPNSFELGVVTPVRSIYSGVIILRLLQSAKEFPENLKEWAREMYKLRVDNPQKFRSSMQRWWTENEKAFSEKRYSEVKPLDGSSILPKMRSLATPISKGILASQSVPSPSLIPANDHAIPITKEASNNLTQVLITLVGLLAGAALFVFYARRKKLSTTGGKAGED